MYLSQASSQDRSCQKAVNDAAVKRVVGGLPLVSTSTGGYCRARQRLPLSMVSELVCCTGELIGSQLPEQWLWQGRRVHLIDGTCVTMPDTQANQAEYPQQSLQKPGLGFPICRPVGVICLSSGAILNATIGRFNGKGSDEQTLLRTLLDTFVFILMAQQRVGNRPGRIEPRAVKRRPKAYPLLMKTRVEARAEVRNYGHPRKLK